MWYDYISVILVSLFAIIDLPKINKKVKKYLIHIKVIILLGILIISLRNIYDENIAQKNLIEDKRAFMDLRGANFWENKKNPHNFYLDLELEKIGQRSAEISDFNSFIIVEKKGDVDGEVYKTFIEYRLDIETNDREKVHPEGVRRFTQEPDEMTKELIKNARGVTLAFHIEYIDDITEKKYIKLMYLEAINLNIEPISFRFSSKEEISRIDSLLKKNVVRYRKLKVYVD